MEKVLDAIVRNLLKIYPKKIILFGSQVRGDSHLESDIDLVVILDIDTVPCSYDEKLDLKVKVRDSIYDLSRKMEIDLVVYTNGEFKEIMRLDTSFYREIMETGKILYEKAG